jgi:RluA family pseudouridine synthase
VPIAPERILYEDEHLLAVNKRSGELVVRGKGEMVKLPLLDLLKKDYPGLRAVHRLDFETSGVVLFAKTKKAADTIINSSFAGWHKLYRALVMGRMERTDGVIRTPLPARGKGTVPAETRYRVLDRFVNSSFVEAEPVTGRHHQIRLHFAGIKHPLVLDAEYGHGKFNQLFRQELGFAKFFLHAARLQLPHPVTGKPLTIEAVPPDQFVKVLKVLRSL